MQGFNPAGGTGCGIMPQIRHRFENFGLENIDGTFGRQFLQFV